MTIAEAWDVMRELAVRHVPVVEDAALVGMLSDRNLAQVDIARLEHKIGAVPVVEPRTREVLGIISYVDVLRALQDLAEED